MNIWISKFLIYSGVKVNLDFFEHRISLFPKIALSMQLQSTNYFKDNYWFIYFPLFEYIYMTVSKYIDIYIYIYMTKVMVSLSLWYGSWPQNFVISAQPMGRKKVTPTKKKKKKT